MDHATIDAESTAERYVTGRLPPAEAARFEEHYFDCPACRARVEAAERLERGLRRLAEQAAAGGPGAARAGHARRSPWWALAAAALFAAALLPAWIELREAQRLRADLAAAGNALAQVDHHQPQANLPFVLLTAGRGAPGAGPVRAVKLPDKPGWIVFWVEPGDVDFPAYQATLRQASGAAVFAGSHLVLNDAGALLVMVHSTALAKGAYHLDVDGLPASGAPVPVDRFSLRID